MITHEIIGDDMQAVRGGAWRLGDEIRAEAGAMTYMTDGIEMDARMTGGILGGLTRSSWRGRASSSPTSSAPAATGPVAFSAPYPGKIMPLRRCSRAR